MPMEDIVRWLRREHDDFHDLADRLRERVAKSPPGTRDRWIGELQARFDDFAASFRRRVADEEKDGYLKPVLEARPSLAAPVELLQHEHVELSRIVDSVQRAVQRLSPKDNLLLRDCCKRIEDLLHWVERHEEHENHIVLYVFAEDTGERTQ
jgi:hemerythrin-like domain-containing protein